MCVRDARTNDVSERDQNSHNDGSTLTRSRGEVSGVLGAGSSGVLKSHFGGG